MDDRVVKAIEIVKSAKSSLDDVVDPELIKDASSIVGDVMQSTKIGKTLMSVIKHVKQYRYKSFLKSAARKISDGKLSEEEVADRINDFNATDDAQEYTYTLFDKAMQSEGTWGASIIGLVWGSTVSEKRRANGAERLICNAARELYNDEIQLIIDSNRLFLPILAETSRMKEIEARVGCNHPEYHRGQSLMAIDLSRLLVNIGRHEHQSHEYVPIFRKLKSLGMLDNGVWNDHANVNAMPDLNYRVNALTSLFVDFAEVARQD